MKLKIAKIIAYRNKCKYVAVDKCGDIYMYSTGKPERHKDEWFNNDHEHSQGFNERIYIGVYRGKKSWKKTLIKATFNKD